MREIFVDTINKNFDNSIEWGLEREENKKLLAEMFISGTSLVNNIPPELLSKITGELLRRVKSA